MSNNTVSITYLGNEGFMVEYAGKKVIVDGLLPERPYGLPGPPRDAIEKMKTSTVPFDNVDLVLVTHAHLDHFDPYIASIFLRNASNTVFISGQLVCDTIKNYTSDLNQIHDKIREITPDIRTVAETEENGIRVKLFRLCHGERTPDYHMQNLGFLFTIEDRTFLHLGDSVADLNENDLKLFRLDRENISIAFVPYWDLIKRNRRKVINSLVDPEQIVGMHIPDFELQRIAADVKKHYKSAVVFETPMDIMTF
ncbi:MBL fold metallo-hydrolase [candidate division KSB1 bacterium]